MIGEEMLPLLGNSTMAARGSPQDPSGYLGFRVAVALIFDLIQLNQAAEMDRQLLIEELIII